MSEWTPKQIDFLENAWGVYPLSHICKALNRTERTVAIKAWEMNLGSQMLASDFISVRELLLTINHITPNNTCYIKELKRVNFPMKEFRPYSKKPVYVVKIEDFWKFCKKNPHRFNLSKMEKNILGVEPPWLERLRKIHKKEPQRKGQRWTGIDNARIRNMLSCGEYKISDVCKALNRTERAIREKARRDKIPVNIKKEKYSYWTDDEINKMLTMKKNMYTEDQIALVLKRPIKSVRLILKNTPKISP